MNNTPKPPMIVWLHEDVSSHMTGIDRWTTARTEHADQIHHQGPYVHLDQFLAEVDRRAKGIMQKWNINIVEARGEALRLLSDDLRRGKQ